MPFRSKSQQKWMFANLPKKAKEWAAETPNIKDLPQHVVKERTKKSIIKKLVKNRK